MNKNEAIALLKQATNVEDWNKKMSHAKKFLSKIEVAQIEQSGLIVQVLGPDKQTS